MREARVHASRRDNKLYRAGDRVRRETFPFVTGGRRSTDTNRYVGRTSISFIVRIDNGGGGLTWEPHVCACARDARPKLIARDGHIPILTRTGRPMR